MSISRNNHFIPRMYLKRYESVMEQLKTAKIEGDKGKDHYHIFNPNATSNKDLYLDENGNPVSKGLAKSHILPKGGKKQ